MKSKRILEALGAVDGQYIAAADPGRKKLPRWTKALAACASLCLVLLGTVGTLLRFDYFRSGCGAWCGNIVEGTYYFTVPHDGVYSYSPEEGTKKQLSAFWEDGWLVNDYGIYYTRGRSLFVQVHETGKRQRLYTAAWWDWTHIGFSLEEDGNVVVTQYDKYRERISEVLVDGVTGQVLGEVTPVISYDEWWNDATPLYSRIHFQVGERTLTLDATGGEYRYDLTEDGRSLLPAGMRVSGATRFGDRLWFRSAGESEDTVTWYVASPDGNDQVVTLPLHTYQTGTGDYLFYVDDSNSGIWCAEASTGQRWKLQTDVDCDFYSIVTDGTWMYTCVPWGEEQVCWELAWEEGRPTALKLVSENIAP